MKEIISFVAVYFAVVINFMSKSAESTGTKTYLSDNGFPIMFLENIVRSPIVQRKLKSRWKWEVWDVVPGTYAYQIYVFNITNPHEVEKGAKPNLQQVGPYFYLEKRYKFDVSINLDLTVNYERNFTYVFDPTKSNGTEEDLVNVPNLPLIIFATLASQTDASKTNEAVNQLTSGGESLIRKGVKVGDLLFNGIDVSKYQKYADLLGTGKDAPSQELISEFKSGLKFGILYLKNGAHEYPYVVNSGLTNRDNVGKIVLWNSLAKLNWWSGERCNAINGSDSSTFPPYLRHDAILQVFDRDLCRSISFEFSGTMLFRNRITGSTYTISDDTFEDPRIFEPNRCFCNSSDINKCLKKGVLDVSVCQGGAPYVMSFPHFLNSNPEYQSSVNGLSPNTQLHQTQIDVEPVTGAVINYRKRLQWNIWIKPMQQIDYFRTVNPIILPLIWNDDVFHLTPDKVDLLEQELASQMGGSGDAASDFLNGLQQANAGTKSHSTQHNIMLLILTTVQLSLSWLW